MRRGRAASRLALLACGALVVGASGGGCATTNATARGAGAEQGPNAKERRALAKKLAPIALRGRWITTRDGETLDQVAKRTGAPILDLEELNGLPRDRALAANSRVFVPRFAAASPGAARRPGAGRSDDARTSPARGASATKQPAGRGSSGARRGSGRMLWPVKGGKLSSRFGKRGGRPHEGIDIAAPEGTAVRAVADGVVIYAGSGIRGYGNLVIVRHRKLVTVYAHNRRNLVRRGTRVSRGDAIAEVGRSGRATGNHLHFEVRLGETPRDPLRYLGQP